ncbi:MAG: VOC family protein [Clostridiales bacterium]|nr:VOC family protein [Clostridiales bacterium]
MLQLGSTYLITKDINKSISFYESLLEMKVSAQAYDRWAQFDFNGHCIALFNPKYDEAFIKTNGSEEHYNQEYIKNFKARKIHYGNNMVLNFYVDDLNEEYKRIKELKIGNVTEIMYLNISSPYYHFLLDDPDGNTIEITGNYNQN